MLLISLKSTAYSDLAEEGETTQKSASLWIGWRSSNTAKAASDELQLRLVKLSGADFCSSDLISNFGRLTCHSGGNIMSASSARRSICPSKIRLWYNG